MGGKKRQKPQTPWEALKAKVVARNGEVTAADILEGSKLVQTNQPAFGDTESASAEVLKAFLPILKAYRGNAGRKGYRPMAVYENMKPTDVVGIVKKWGAR